MCEGPAALNTVLASAVAEMEQRGSTGSVHLLTLPLEKRCVPPPSAKGHDQAMASEKGGSEKPRLALYAIDSALTHSVFRKVQSHGRIERTDGQ